MDLALVEPGLGYGGSCRVEAWRACCGSDKSLDGLRSRVLGGRGGANAEYED